jgi:histidine triad (HIT) family protein
MKRLLLRLARARAGRFFLGWIFTHMSFLIPAKRLAETPTLLAFEHPRPTYRVHILLVPRRSIAGLRELSPDDGDFMRDLFMTVKRLVAELELEAAGYRLICNGGAYQDVPHLHFHLVAD